MDRHPYKGTLGWGTVCVWGFAIAGAAWQLSAYVRRYDWLEIPLVIPYAPVAILVDPNGALLNYRHIHFFALANWVAIFLLGALFGWCLRMDRASRADAVPPATAKRHRQSSTTFAWATLCATLFVAAQTVYHLGLWLPRFGVFRAASPVPFAPLILLAGRRGRGLSEVRQVYLFALANWAGIFLLGRVFLRLDRRPEPGGRTARLWLATGSVLLGGVLCWRLRLTLLDAGWGQLHDDCLQPAIVAAYVMAALAAFALIRGWRAPGKTAVACRITHLAYLAIFAVAAVMYHIGALSAPRHYT